MERTEAVAPIIEGGWVVGADVRPAQDRDAEPTQIRARFVVAADGAASRFAKPAGVQRDDSRPLGIAARRYYRTSYHPGPWFESWLDLWEGDLLLPGYGWLFPVAGGQINLGAGLLNTFKDFKQVSAQRLFDAFSTMLPAGWEINEDTAEGRVLSGPLPMSLNRVPQAVPGMLLVGDAAGAVNPFNGEGIAYAMETGEIAAELIARGAGEGPPGHRDDVPRPCCGSATATTSRSVVGSRKLIGNPAIMGRATRYLLPNPRVMSFAMRLMANLTDGKRRRRAGPAVRAHRNGSRGRVVTRRMLARADRLPPDRGAGGAGGGVRGRLAGRVALRSGPTARTP